MGENKTAYTRASRPRRINTGLTHLEVNTITGNEDMTKEKDMEDACHDENRRKIITDIQHTPHEQTNIPGDKIQRNL